jgi:hypothetical protein
MLRIVIALFALALMAGAQPDPCFTWKGQVDGIIVLHIRGEHVDIEYQQGAPVERQSYQFYNALPDVTQNVRVQELEGRGSVRVTQQPGIDNNYTANVTIEDRQDGSALYSIALYWDEAVSVSGRRDRVTWSGRVAGEAVVECKGARCQSTVQSGPPIGRERFKFTHPLPDSSVRVSLDDTNGRGDVRLLEQPSSRNSYTAKVLVRGFAGGGQCSFVLSWPRLRSRAK